MMIVFAGDFMPLRPFGDSPFPESAKVVANLECAISTGAAVGSKAYSLVLGQEALDVVARSRFAALSVANNHACDAGVAAFDRMIKSLADCCETQIYGTRQAPYATLVEGDRRCAVIGCLERCRSRRGSIFHEEDVASLIQDLARDYDRVFVTPHWGKEGECASHPSPQQRGLARRWIRAGAHAILGHHAHSFHGREQVQGHPVYYSLGNLVFDHEEGKRYVLTNFGLAATWSAGPSAEADRWQEQILFQRSGTLQVLESESENILSKYLEAISEDLTRGHWGSIQWARAIGHIYIPKSRAALALRMAKHNHPKILAIRIVWGLLPTTILLKWGNWFPDQQIKTRRKLLEQQLRSQYSL